MANLAQEQVKTD